MPIHKLPPEHSPVPTRAITSSAPMMMMSTEYAEAVKLLDEATMTQACECLLKDDDDDGDGDAAVEQLLQVYYKCESAWKVIQQQRHPTDGISSISSMPLAPTLLPSPGGGVVLPPRRGSLPPNPTKKSSVSKGGVIPMRRTVAMKPPVANKKARTNSISSTPTTPTTPTNPQQSPSTSAAAANNNNNNSNPLAPPPSALHFLAKLNHDGSSSGPGPVGVDTGGVGSTTPSIPTSKRNLPRTQHRRSSA